ncbi:hypothetical protein V6N13_070425 [Hibiscus sabdariffa]
MEDSSFIIFDLILENERRHSCLAREVNELRDLYSKATETVEKERLRRLIWQAQMSDSEFNRLRIQEEDYWNSWQQKSRERDAAFDAIRRLEHNLSGKTTITIRSMYALNIVMDLYTNMHWRGNIRNAANNYHAFHAIEDWAHVLEFPPHRIHGW